MMNVNALTPSPFRPQSPLPQIDHQAPASQGSHHSTPLTSLETSRPATNASLERALADKQNLKTLGQKISETATHLGVNATPQAILAALRATPMSIHPGSSYPTEAGASVTLDTYLTSSGLAFPTSHFALTALADAVFNRAMEHPLGNFGGGLSWPLPLSTAGQRTVLDTANRHAMYRPNTPQMGPSLGILEYLNSNRPPSGDAGTDCAFHAIRPLSPPTSGHLFHAHPARQSERSDAGLHC